MSQWAASQDDEPQQGAGATNTPIWQTVTSSNDEVPHPLMDYGQGKFENDGGDKVPATGQESDDGSKDVASEEEEGRDGSSIDVEDNATGNKIAITEDNYPIAGAPHIINKSVRLRKCESTPPPHGATPSSGGSKPAQFAPPPPYGATPPLSGLKSVRFASPPPYGATPPSGESNSVRPRKCESIPPQQSLEGLQPPILEQTGGLLTGAETDKLRLQNKRRRHALQDQQVPSTLWSTHTGQASLPPKHERPLDYRNEMCPAGIATSHPAGELLAEWAQMGCPTKTGRPWSKDEMWEAVARGPHQSSLSTEAIAHFAVEGAEKVRVGQAKLVMWDDIKDNPPPQLKISPIAAIPHKSKAFRSILDLSFSLRLKNGGMLESVNDSTVKMAPRGALDQLGQSLSRIIHAFAEADDNAKIFMAKWDIKDGFWRMDCEEGEEYNFAYVLPQEEGMPITLVVPTSLQMGWVESPPYFCAATETARDIASDYCNTPVGSLPKHKFAKHATGAKEFDELPTTTTKGELFYALEVYVDDFMSIVIPTSQEQLEHVATAIMMGIHDVFPADIVDSNDPISEKKLVKGEGQYSLFKTILGFDFDGKRKTMWLEEEKRAKLLTILHSWLRAGSLNRGIPFREFESVIAKLRHAFTALPGGRGLLSPCNRLLKRRPPVVYFHRNEPLHAAISNCRTILRESTNRPTRCRELVAGWPDFIGVVDASSHGVGGVIIGELSECPPTVFRLQWPPDITANVISEATPEGTITNSDLELAGLVLLWLMMEHVCGPLAEKRIALFSDNSPTVSWVQRMACRSSLVAEQLIRVLALRFNIHKICPITTLHIAGDQNSMTDIPSRSFGSEQKWHFQSEHELLTFFNANFTLPLQNSWTVCQPTFAIATRVISVLRMTPFTLDDWRRLPAAGKNIGIIGKSTRQLWEWTLTFRVPTSKSGSDSYPVSQQESERDTMVRENKLKIAQSVARLQPLGRRSRWPVTPILPK